ncbi:hypothetical protein E2562_020017 [Oryza meyeriana var. granulata]|uniref:Uncharacterized protein n=1 Tax=Oryza meyeriana var. granulata TaxID=110450 RepID=A0A6G1FAI8_9ORYZ|nr:hypothetical protein E2562_020017 [Oryza meyeriana var. granulata]
MTAFTLAMPAPTNITAKDVEEAIMKEFHQRADIIKRLVGQRWTLERIETNFIHPIDTRTINLWAWTVPEFDPQAVLAHFYQACQRGRGRLRACHGGAPRALAAHGQV